MEKNIKKDVKVEVVYTNALGMPVKVKKVLPAAELKDDLHDHRFSLEKILVS